MTKLCSETDRMSNKSHYSKQQHSSNYFSPKIFIYLFSALVTLFILFQISSLHLQSPPSSLTNCTLSPNTMAAKLRQAVTFLPLKDLRYAQTAMQGHTWFMSSTYDTHVEGEVQYQRFPSPSSHGRLLCIKGRNTHDGAWNSYALAWPEALPNNATLFKGLTFISYNHYDYGNIWHGLSAMVPFVGWHRRNGCAMPTRWILYHWGELRRKMTNKWLETLMGATFGGALYVEGFDDGDDDMVDCFEEAVVMRHNEGGMSRERRMEVYDLMRCKARVYCNVSTEGRDVQDSDRGVVDVGMTLLLRTGGRSFRNDSAVAGVFGTECEKVAGCRLRVAYASNLSFCEQVKLMRLTDVLISPHGAQLSNMIFMDRNSSVMEFFPKGWLKLAGVGQHVFQWLASWSGMRHQGAWRDPKGDTCPYPEDDRRCMSVYKNSKIGYNETYFAEWVRNVLREVTLRKVEEGSNGSHAPPFACACS